MTFKPMQIVNNVKNQIKSGLYLRIVLVLCAFSTSVLSSQNGDDMYLDNAKYLYAKNSSNTNTRVIGINSSNNLYIGSVDASVDNLFINLNGQNHLNIKGSNGDIGLGTANPASKLHIYEGNSGGTPHSFSDLTVEDSAQGMISILTPNDENAYYGFADEDDEFVAGIQYFHPNDIMYFRVNNHASDMVINKDGNVGIGTDTPGRKLDVQGEIRSINGSDRMSLLVDETNNISEINWGDDSNDRLRFLYNHWNGTANDREVMTLLSDGKVGIGTSTPDAELAVNGDIHAKEVKVDLVGWPDYVFENSYQLPTLEEVEKHIKEEGHLINIPSSELVEANGIELGEMNKLLLEKIEELTLYTIQQEKKITQQDEEIRQLKLLEKRITQLEQKTNN